MSNNESPELLSIWEEAKGHIDLGDHDKAIEIYKYIILRYGDDAIAVECANAYLGDLYLTLSRLNLAEKHLKAAISQAPSKPHYHYLLGFTYSKGRRWASAVREFGQAIKLEPDNDEYHRGLGWALFNGGDRVNGLDHLHKAVELSPSNANSLADLAAAMMLLGNIDQAREYGERAVRADPGNNVARGLLEKIAEVQRISGSQQQRS